MGFIATRSIRFGELVFSEPPLFTLPTASQGLSAILSALVSKSDIQKKQYLELTNYQSQLHGLHPVEGLFFSNALPCGNNGMGAVAAKAGIFLEGCRFNSSCVPNVGNYWNEGRGIIEFWALKDIEEGEELCTFYLVGFETRAARRRKLRQSWGFECHCATCSLSGDALKASDERRTMLSILMEEIGNCGNRPGEGVKKVRLSRVEFYMNRSPIIRH